MRIKRHRLGSGFWGSMLALLWVLSGGAAFSPGAFAITITTTQLDDAFVNTPYDFTLSASDCCGSCFYEITSGWCGWLSLDSATGVLSGVPGYGDTGDKTIVATVRDDTGDVANKAFTLRVGQDLTILSTTLPNGMIDTPYSEKIRLQGAIGTLAFAVTGGTVPPGLSLDPGTGVFSGTPTTVGAHTATVQVTDSSYPTPQVKCGDVTITINSASTLTVVTDGELPQTAYDTDMTSIPLAAAGGANPDSYIWSIAEGFLPEGVALSEAGEIAGRPVDKGDFYFTVQVIDSAGLEVQQAAQKAFHLYVFDTLYITNSPPTSIAFNLPFMFALTTYGGTPPFTWALESGSLPTGTILDPTTGTLSGTPTVTGESTSFTVQVTDGGSSPQVQTLGCAIDVSTDFMILTQYLPDGKVGVTYPSTAIAWTPGTAPYVFLATSGTVPPGLCFSYGPGPEAATLSGTPVSEGLYTFTATVADSIVPTGQIAEKQFYAYIIWDDVQITTTSLKAAWKDTEYRGRLQADFGKKPYTWQICEGALPLGLVLNSITGHISGTPASAAVTSAFKVRVTDSASSYSEQEFSIVVVEPLSITEKTLAAGEVDMAYSDTLAATGGVEPYTWRWHGNRPPGLSLDSSTGAITGTPPQEGTFSFSVQVKDDEGRKASADFSIEVKGKLTIDDKTLETAEGGMAYNETLTATGGVTDYTWALKAGSSPLPDGLTLDAGGTISGTVAANITEGDYPFTAQVTDSLTPTAATATHDFTIQVKPKLAVTEIALLQGEVDMPYSQTFEATGGVLPYTWSLKTGTLPDGLELDPTTAELSGTPTAEGTFTFTIEVQDSLQPTNATASREFTLEVKNHVAVTPATLLVSEVGVAYSQTIEVTGGVPPYTWFLKAGTLPDGLEMDPTTGEISGVSTTPGGRTFTIQVTDSLTPTAATDVVGFSIRTKAHVAIADMALLKGEVGMPYSQTFEATGGVLPYTWSSADLPAWLTLDPSTGTITGTPTASGAFTFNMEVADSLSPDASTDTKSFTVTVLQHVAVTAATLLQGEEKMAYNQIIAATGGQAPYIFELVEGNLPAGVTLNHTTGRISGKPALGTARTYTFKIQATDSLTPIGATSQAVSFTITIVPHVAFTTAAKLPAGEIGVPYDEFLDLEDGIPGYAWKRTSGTLPNGLTLNTGTGKITGTPTKAGTFSFTVQGTDSLTPTAATTSRTFKIVVKSTVKITTTKLKNGRRGTPYKEAVKATGGFGAYHWEADGLPGGLAINRNTGVISGTPREWGRFRAIITVTDDYSVQDTRIYIFSIFQN